MENEMDETTMDEVIRRATTAGHIRSNHAEAKGLIEHLLANGFQYVGPSLEREKQRITPHAITADGKPVWRR
jgi:hypothetical protein